MRVLDEMLGTCLLAPLFRATLTDALAPALFVSDATLTKGAVAETCISPHEAAFLWSRAPTRGGATRLEHSGDEDFVRKPLFREHKVQKDMPLESFVAPKQFVQSSIFSFNKQSHVNIQEARALRAVVRIAARRPSHHHSRLLVAVDSRVVQGAFIRGRSSSSALNRVLKTVVPFLLACRIRLVVLWLSSAANPADDGTRDVALRAAVSPSKALKMLVAEVAEAQTRVLKVHQCIFKSHVPVFWDLFSGPNAPLASAFQELGWIVLIRDTLIGGADHDLTKEENINFLRHEASIRPPDAANLGPPCSSFGPWIWTTSWNSRTLENPWGDGVHPKEVYGNNMVRAALKLLDLLDEVSCLWIWEQPVASLQWRIPELVAKLAERDSYRSCFDWCGWGHPWRKRTGLRGRSPVIMDMTRHCTRDHEHVILQGPADTKEKDQEGRVIRQTAVAAEYSRQWCRHYAQRTDALVRSRG